MSKFCIHLKFQISLTNEKYLITSRAHTELTLPGCSTLQLAASQANNKLLSRVMVATRGGRSDRSSSFWSSPKPRPISDNTSILGASHAAVTGFLLFNFFWEELYYLLDLILEIICWKFPHENSSFLVFEAFPRKVFIWEIFSSTKHLQIQYVCKLFHILKNNNVHLCNSM